MSLQKLFRQQIEALLQIKEPSSGFYTEGGVLNGDLVVNVAKKAPVKSVSVQLRCQETSAVAVNLEDRDSQVACRSESQPSTGIVPLSTTDSKIHWEETHEFLPAGQHEVSQKTELEEGKYTYSFSFKIPRLAQSPGSATISSRNGLEFGVTWEIRAIIRRPGLALKRKVSAVIPVYNDTPILPYHQERGHLNGMKYITASKNPVLSDQDQNQNISDHDSVVVGFDMEFPSVALPQSPLSLQLALSLSCSHRNLIFLEGIRLSLIRHCHVRAKHLMDTYTRKYEIGSTLEHRMLQDNVLDLTPKVARMGLPSSFPPSFRTSLLQWSYELEVEVEVSTHDKKKEVIASSIPVSLASLVASLRAAEDTSLTHAQPAMSLDFRSQEQTNQSKVQKKVVSQKRPVFEPANPSSLANVSAEPDENVFPQISSKEKILSLEELNASLDVVADLMINNGVWYEKFLADNKDNSDLSGEFSFQSDTSGKKTRHYKYKKSLNGSIGPKSTTCLSTDTLETFNPDANAVILIATKTPDVPSGDAFVTMTKVCLARSKNNRTKIRLSSWLDWEGKSWLKAAIEKGAISGQVENCRMLINCLRSSTGETVPINEEVKESAGQSYGIPQAYSIIAIVLALAIYFVFIR